MNAVILAAGFGGRLWPLTENSHKTLLLVGGDTVLARMVAVLLGLGVGDITIVTGHCAGAVRDHLSSRFPGHAFRFVHNPNYAGTNNIVSLQLAMQALPQGCDILLLEADLVFDKDLLGRLLAHPASDIALVDRYRPGMNGTAVMVDKGQVTRFVPLKTQAPDFDFSTAFKTINIYKLGRDFCDLHLRPLLDFAIRSQGPHDYYESVFGLAVDRGLVAMHVQMADEATWEEIDDANDLARARFVFEPEQRLDRLDAAFGGLWNYAVTDFCYPRNLHFPDDFVLAELKDRLGRVITQYGSAQPVLDAKIAHYLNCAAENAVFLNGLSQIFPLLKHYFAGRRVLLPAPTFGEFARAFPEAEIYPDAVGFDWARIVTQAKSCDVVVFVNPNNPTGSWLPAHGLLDFARDNPGKTVLVDESFADFSTEPGLFALLRDRPLQNIILLKSLSKSLGVPGLRLGFAHAADAAFLAWVRAQLPVWNGNSLAELFLETALRHRKVIAQSLEQTRLDRALFLQALQNHPLVEQVWPSQGNFLLVRLTLARARLKSFLNQLLQRHGFYVKDVSGKFPPAGAWIRLAVRLPEENRRLLDAMASLAGDFGSS